MNVQCSLIWECCVANEEITILIYENISISSLIPWKVLNGCMWERERERQRV